MVMKHILKILKTFYHQLSKCLEIKCHTNLFSENSIWEYLSEFENVISDSSDNNWLP